MNNDKYKEILEMTMRVINPQNYLFLSMSMTPEEIEEKIREELEQMTKEELREHLENCRRALEPGKIIKGG